jgi:hypothetical protein
MISAQKILSLLYTLLVLLPCSLPAFPLDSVFNRGDSCLAVEWTPDSINTRSAWYVQNGSLCTGSDTVYRHSDFIAGTTYRGIAYSYGGEDPYFVFRDKIGKGYPAGSHLCHYSTFGDPSSVIAGTDCSGFVCYVWNVPRTSTGGLIADSRYQQIPRSLMEPGDILVKAGSHTVLIVEKDDSTNYLIWESTSAVNGCRERIIDISDPAWNAYSALRNPEIARTTGDITNKDIRQPLSLVKSITMSRDGTALLLILNRPLSGQCILYNASGKRIAAVQVNAASGNISLPLGVPKSRGMYLLTFSGLRSSLETVRWIVGR